MKEAAVRLLGLLCVAAVAGLPRPASAESLRCPGGIVAEGDTRLSVIYKCGQPQFADTFCAPVYYPGTIQLVPEPFASAVVPCQLIEEWLYDRGAGNLVATVFVRSGVVQTIVYGREPR